MTVFAFSVLLLRGARWERDVTVHIGWSYIDLIVMYLCKFLRPPSTILINLTIRSQTRENVKPMVV
jgi:hypothetical protein